MRRPHPLQYFPFLSSDNHIVASPESIDYNCVAWAAGVDDCQLWPGTEEGFEWPSDLPSEESMDTFVAYFERIGYQVCESSTLEQGFEKLAIFADDCGPTHVARQLPSGKWASKMGWDGVDIEHEGLDCIAGNRYGKARVFLKRTTNG